MKSQLRLFSILLLLFQVANATAQSDTSFTLSFTQPITSGEDDVEEYANGVISFNSNDLELVNDGNIGNQTIGLRFPDLPIGQGIKIEEAYLQFTAKNEANSGFSKMEIKTEATDDAVAFDTSAFNVSNRLRSDSKVDWLPGGWTIHWEAGEKQKTPDLKDLLQEVVDRPGWQAGNAMAFIITGSGKRVATAFELDADKAVKLIVKIAQPAHDTLLQSLYINEIMPSNDKILDEYEEADDWFEIYNGSNQPVFLGGLYVTDDVSDLQKWQITESGWHEPGDFELFWADGQPEQGGQHTNFKLKKAGEELALVQEVNGVLHILDQVSFPEVPTDISYGREEDGLNNWVFFGAPSPKASNTGEQQYLDASVQFSKSGGHYPGSITLEMTASDSTADIYYTLDGSIPTDLDFLFQGSLLVDKTMAVTAKAFKPGYISLATTSAVYFINENSQLPILSVQSDPEGLWDDQRGIYVSGTNGSVTYCENTPRNWNQDWERPCELTYYEPNGAEGFAVNAGMKIGGNCSRDQKMKSLNFYMRGNTYGDELIDYPIFPNLELTEFRRIKARNGGTDWIEMLFRDGMNHVILDNTADLDIMAYRPVRVYLNGEFWGVYGLRENFSKHYIESHHGVDGENLDVLANPYGGLGVGVREGDLDRFDEMWRFMERNNLSDPAHYQTMQEFIDLQNYLDYNIVQIYLANYDWPFNNVRMWRERDGGKFRWMLFDTDASTGFDSWNGKCKAYYNNMAHVLNTQPVSLLGGWPNDPRSTFMFRSMMKSEAFRNEFIQRSCTFREMFFQPERIHPMVDSVAALLRPEMARHITKWNGHNDLGKNTPSGGSVNRWEAFVKQYKDFFEDRPSFILNHYKSTLNLNETFELAFGVHDTTKGEVFIHENEMKVPVNYEATYFTNIPIKIKAVPQEGYFFSHWLETGDTLAVTTFTGTRDGSITPIFTTSKMRDTIVVPTPDPLWHVSIYPNPTKYRFWVDYAFPESESAELKIFNALGQMVFTQILEYDGEEFRQEKIWIDHLGPGVYWIKVKDDQERIFVKKLLIL